MGVQPSILVQALSRSFSAKSLWIELVTVSEAHFSCAMLCLQYRNPWGYLRIARLLEDLDSLAGSIAFQHW